MARQRRAVWVLLIILSCIAGDHIAKGLARTYLPPATIVSLAGDTVRLQYAVNHGAVFNFENLLPPPCQGGPVTVASAVFAAGLGAFLLLGPPLRRLPLTALSLFCGGLLSNLLDRAVDGFAIDFLRLHWGPWHTDVFNLADVCLVGGSLLFACSLLCRQRPARIPKTAEPGSKSSLSP